jgi:hypothetical protein
MTRVHSVCAATAIAGVVLGFVFIGWADVAMAQDAPPSQIVGSSVQSSDAEMLLRLIAGGGLPAVLGVIAWWLPRAITGLVREIIASAVDQLKTWEPTINVKLPQSEVDQIAALNSRVDALLSRLEAAERQNTSG